MAESKQNVTNPDLDTIDLAIIDLIIGEPAISKTEIAKRLNLNRKTVMLHLCKPGVADVVKDHQISVIEYKKELQYKALKKIEELVDHVDPQISLGASKELAKDIEPAKAIVDLNIPQISIAFNNAVNPSDKT